jgi:hypothetical protein
MPTSQTQPVKQEYNSRWFIWTIVFLVVTGISLVSYIMLSDSGNNDTSPIVVSAQAKHNPVK